jgi:Zn-dependent protease with chaperone function
VVRTTAYRYPGEHFILLATLALVGGVIALTAAATVCASVIFILAFILLSFYSTRSHHQALLRSARQVTPQNTPQLAEIAQDGIDRLQPGEVQLFLAPNRELNAYTFGLDTPKVVVLYSALLQVMDRDELLFILGHELGHVALGHTWLNSLVGGIAGIPSSSSVGMLMTLAFLWWNRACEYSADRAGLLACGKPEKAISALVKLAAGPQADTPVELAQAYRQIDAEDDTWMGGLNEALATHPMLIRRIRQIRAYAGTAEYRRLVERMAQAG